VPLGGWVVVAGAGMVVGARMVGHPCRGAGVPQVIHWWHLTSQQVLANRILPEVASDNP
jgi:hypothetical protein